MRSVLDGVTIGCDFTIYAPYSSPYSSEKRREPSVEDQSLQSEGLFIGLCARSYYGDKIMAESTIATATIAGVVGVVGALAGLVANVLVARAETRRRNWEYQMKRRSERQEAYLAAIDLVTEWQWRQDDSDFNVMSDFTLNVTTQVGRRRREQED